MENQLTLCNASLLRSSIFWSGKFLVTMKTFLFTFGLVFAFLLKDFVACQLQFGGENQPRSENVDTGKTVNIDLSLRQSEDNSIKKKGLLGITTLSKKQC
jgi:hypothetical protein